MVIVGILLALLVLASTAWCLWLLPSIINRADAQLEECPHNVWGVDEDDKVVCLDCGRRVRSSR
jgi:hypothetical protein